MGVYLSTPIKEKFSSDSENATLKCGASSMQGWRTSQEDAHNCCLDFDTNISLFAVYDGHGGHEVAKYASDELPNLIKTLESYKNGEYEAALRESFLRFDATLKETEVAEKLKKIAKEAKDKSDAEEDEIEDEDENDLKNLKNEANMPLTEVLLTNYTGIQKTPANKRLNLGESSKSPFLRAKTSSSADTEVSSSSSSSKEPTTNGVPESNGVAKKPDIESAVSSTSTVTNGDEAVDSTSEAGHSDKNNEEKAESCDSSSGPAKGERMSKKKAKKIVLNALLNELDTYDSDESDSSFDAGERTVSSDDDDDEEDSKLNGSKVSNDDDEDDDSDEEAEEEEDEDEDEDEDEEADICANEEPGVDSGCTAVVALVTSDKLFVANAGDSRAVLCRKGEAVDMSVDHKPEDAPELKRILAAGGDVTNGRVNGGLNLSRALGDHFYKRSEKVDATEQMITALPDIKIEDIKPEDEFIVIACDGIWNSMTSQEVVNFVRPRLAKGEKPSFICEELFEKCLAPNTLGDGTGCDNMTCVIVQFSSNKIQIDENSAEEKTENLRPRDETSEDADSGIPLAKKARVES